MEVRKIKHMIPIMLLTPSLLYVYRGYNIRFFMSGDYEFLCALYGTSGASGKQPCLFCLVTLDDLESGCGLRAANTRVNA